MAAAGGAAKHWRETGIGMRLGWDEIKRRAKAFSEEWKDAHYERGQTQTFYNEFFEIFGIKRKQVAIYEQREIGRASCWERVLQVV